MRTFKPTPMDLIEIDGEVYSLDELKQLVKNTHELERKTRFIKALKLNNCELTIERNGLIQELHDIKNMSMFDFARRYCTSQDLEEAGHKLARDLLGK